MREQINFFTTEDTKCLMKSNKLMFGNQTQANSVIQLTSIGFDNQT